MRRAYWLDSDRFKGKPMDLFTLVGKIVLDADGFSEKMKIKEEFHPEMWYNLITTKNHAKQIRRNSSWLIIQQIQAL